MYSGTEIAIVGLSGRFPGARDTNEYWSNLHNGVESIRFYSRDELIAVGVDPDLVDDPDYVPANGAIADPSQFDADFFGFSPRDAAIMDPQHRLFLECTWEALENAGYNPDKYEGSIGVFAGSGMTSYMMYNLVTNPRLMDSVGEFLLRHTGNDKDFLTTRVSYNFNLTGPSVNVQTACSTSLVAIHIAAQNLLNGECDLALAGGVTIMLQQDRGYLYEQGEILSPDGHCRPFDADSQGTVFGSGCGVVVLKRLQDAIDDRDTIHAIVRGSAINNDGALKVSYLAPSVDGQAKVIAEALAIAELDPSDISYIEAHGTGTPVGDPIEVTALKEVFGSGPEKHCAIGSAKSNIGHLDTAAGIAGLIKVVGALKNEAIPPTLHFESPNPKLGIEDSPFYVADKLVDWKKGDTPRRAGISSLGVGGTNAHIILEEAPVRSHVGSTRPFYLLPLSAKTESALDASARQLSNYLKEHPDVDLADVAYTLSVGREEFSKRRILAAATTAECAAVLAEGAKPRVISGDSEGAVSQVVFMFAGGGAQYAGMGKQLYEDEPVYRQVLDECHTILMSRENLDLKNALFPGSDTNSVDLEQPSIALPALFSTAYAVAKLLISKGVSPAAMTGHSMGEYTAACLAGVMSLPDALSLVSERGRLFETLEAGSMLSVDLPEAELAARLPDDLSIAAVNAPGLCVASGPSESIDRLAKVLEAEEIDCRQIKINVAAHSAMVEPILDAFRSKVQQIKLAAPQAPFISNVTGTWITDTQATDPEYWVEHIRKTVRFADGIGTLLQDSSNVFLEVGPGRTLSSLTRMHPDFSKPGRSLSTLRHPQEDTNDTCFLLTSIGQLWLEGVPMDWELIFGDEQPFRIPLPTYPFERQRHWIEAGKTVYQESSTIDDSEVELHRIENISDWFYVPEFVSAEIPTPTKVDEFDWVIFSDESSFARDVVSVAANHAARIVQVKSGRGEDTELLYHVDPNAPEAFGNLIARLLKDGVNPGRFIYFWKDNGDLDSGIRNSFSNLLSIEQAIAEEDLTTSLNVFTFGLYESEHPNSHSHLLQALSTGPVLVGPRELSNFESRLIDVEAASGNKTAQRAINLILSEHPAKIWKVDASSAKFEKLSKQKAEVPDASTVQFKQNGTYLITGGLGGIGSEIARHLAEEFNARLILTGRSDLPDRESWTEILASDSRDAARIRTMIALENSGGEVLFVKADVRRDADLKRVASECSKRYGKLNGIIHAAGVLRDNLIQLKTEDEALRVLGPKVNGSLALEKAFDFSSLDFAILFSSTSSRLGLPGQIDYASANAFLNVFARYASRRYSTKVVALNWGMWSEVGMTATGSNSASRPAGVEVRFNHPLFSGKFEADGVPTGFSIDVDKTSDWFFTEHQVHNMGPVLPGTMYVELALSAAEQLFGHRNICAKNLFFLAPCTLNDADTGRIFVTVDKISSGYRFTISSFAAGVDGLHVSGILQEVPHLETTSDLDAIRDRCSIDVRNINRNGKLKQEEVLLFGPRWKNVDRIFLGDHEAFGELALGEDFTSDLEAFSYHPALLDMATGFALPLIQGFETFDGLYAPLSYKTIRVNGSIPSKVYSHVIYKGNGGGAEVAPFDIVIYDADGNSVAEITEFVMRHTQGSQLATPGAGPTDRADTAAQSESELMLIGREHGIRPDDGIEIIKQVLSGVDRPEVVASSIDIADLTRFIDSMQSATSGLTGGTTSGDYVAPRDDVETMLCTFWQDLLGIEKIGIDQDFFDAGGHSLIAVRLFTKIRKKFGVELSLASLFTAPTIMECADLIRGELDLPAPSEATSTGIAAEDVEMATRTAITTVLNQDGKKKASTHQALVPIRKGSGPPAFYCVHGAGGNVLNFWDISRHLGQDQPFFGLQMRGVDGKHAPPQSVEEMAREYVDAVIEQQPQGPYCIGGYSGGGVVAYEMARQMKEAGHEIALLVFFDTFCPNLPSKPGRATSQKVSAHLEGLKQEKLPYLKGFLIDRFRFERNRLRKKMIGLYHKLGLKLPIELREIILVEAYHRAQDKYELKPYSGAATLFTASVRGHAFSHVDDDLGWASVDGLELEIVLIPGDHDTLVLEPNVNVLATQLQKRLTAVRQQLPRELKSAV